MLIGNLTRDPELRYTPSGTPVCSFGLATNRSWVASGSNDRQEETEFHNIVAWSKLAELCAQLLAKGRKVYIEGRLQTRSWETTSGEKRVKTEIVAEDMIVLDNKFKNAGEDTQMGDVEPVEEKEDFSSMETDTPQAAVPVAEVPEQSSTDTSSEDQKEDIDLDKIPF